EGAKRYVATPLAVGRYCESTEFTRIFQIAFASINLPKRAVISEPIEKVIRLITTNDMNDELDDNNCDICIILSTEKTKQGFEFVVCIKNMEMPLAAWRFFDIRIPACQDIRKNFEYKDFIQ